MVRAVLIAALRFEIEKMAKSLIHDSPKVKRAQEIHVKKQLSPRTEMIGDDL